MVTTGTIGIVVLVEHSIATNPLASNFNACFLHSHDPGPQVSGAIGIGTTTHRNSKRVFFGFDVFSKDKEDWVPHGFHSAFQQVPV